MSIPDFALTALCLKARQILIGAAFEEEPKRAARMKRAKAVKWKKRSFIVMKNGAWSVFGITESGRQTIIYFDRVHCNCPDTLTSGRFGQRPVCKHKISMANAILNYSQNKEQ